MSGATGLRFNFSSSSRPAFQYGDGGESNGLDAPFFERIGTAEELQQCKRLIETLQMRVMDLERINVDLEYRLEDQAKQCMTTEKECTSVERKWRAKCETLEKDIETWKRDYEAEKQRAARLREHLSRTERELYSILQRKYELMRAGPAGGGSSSQKLGSTSGGALSGGGAAGGPQQALMRGGKAGGGGGGGSGGFHQQHRRNSFENEASNGSDLRRSSHVGDDSYGLQQARAPQEIRQRRMMASLTDFLGL